MGGFLEEVYISAIPSKVLPKKLTQWNIATY